MNYYLETDTNQVYAYDDQQVEEGWVKEGLVPITEEEAMAITQPPAPAPPPAPMPFDPTTELANPTIAEWNSLCVAAGAPELQK